jgi:hypothetical protein
MGKEGEVGIPPPALCCWEFGIQQNLQIPQVSRLEGAKAKIIVVQSEKV